MSKTNDKPNYVKGITPKGRLVFPNLNKPDKKFDTWNAKIRLDPEASEALIEKIEGVLKEYWPVAKKELEDKLANAKTGKEKGAAKKALEEMKEADRGYKPAYDDDGNETGEYEFNFKSPTSYKSKRQTNEDGTPKLMPITIDIFDAKGKPLKGSKVPMIYGGTVAKVGYELRPFSTPVGVGVGLRLKAVQIIELRSGGGPRDASEYGFGAEEGYEASEGEDSGAGFGDETGSGDGRPTTPAGGGEDF